MSLIRRNISWKFILLILAFLVACVGAWWVLMMRRPMGPTWRGITVGRSTSTDVERVLGDPSSVEVENDETSIFRYTTPEQSLPHAAHEIAIRDGVVDLIKEDMGVYYPQRVYLMQYVQTYGVPDHVFWSSDEVGRILVWSQAGMLLDVNALLLNESTVTNAYYFRPCSLPCIMLTFRDLISLSDLNIGSDSTSGPRDPWGFTQGIFP